MPLDPAIILSGQQPQLQGPLDSYQKLLALRNAQQTNALNAQQVQGAELENQQRQLQIQQTQALNDDYRNAITTSEDGSATIDTDKLSRALAAGGHGAAIPSVLKGVADYQKSLADMKNQLADLRTKQIDSAGGVGATLQQSNYDPRLFLTLASHAVADKAVNGAAIAPLLQQVQDALQKDPSEAAARQIVQRVADQWVAQSPEQQKIASQRMGDKARLLQATTGAARQANEAAGQLADSAMKQQKAKGLLFGNATNQAEWDAAIQRAKAAGADLSDVPVGFSPQAAQRFAQLSLTAKDKAELTNAATNTRLHQQSVEIEQRRLNNELQFTAPANAATLTGDEFLQKLAPGVASQVKAMAEGRMPAPSPGNRSQAAQNLLGLLNQYDPNFNGGRYALNKDITSGKLADNIRSINTSIQHMGELKDATDALHNDNDIRKINDLANQFGYAAKGKGGLPAAELAKTMVRGELAKAATGGNVTVEEQQALGKSLDTAQTPQAVAAVARTAAHLLGGKLGAIKDQYLQVMGPRAPKLNILSPRSRGTLQSLGVDPDEVERESSGPSGTPGLPAIGSVFNGGKVLRVTKVQ